MGKQEEVEFHDRFVTTTDLRSFEGKFYSVTAQEKEESLAFEYLGDLSNRRLLFYGAGGHFSMIRKFVQRGALVTAIDISPETIESLKRAVASEGMDAKCTLLVMDCESLQIADSSMDIVFARSIIHHLDTELSLKEIKRVLAPNGKLVALEPLGTNPVINVYRYFTPQSRTRGEHPFVPRDLKLFFRYFGKVHVHYLYFLSIFSYVYRMLDPNDARFVKVFRFLDGIDNALVRGVPLYRYLCWEAILCCQKTEESR